MCCIFKYVIVFLLLSKFPAKAGNLMKLHKTGNAERDVQLL